MSRRWPVFILWVFPLAGCLQAGPEPAGRQLFHGQNIESPAFFSMGDTTMLRFSERKAFATSDKGGVTDLWISTFDGALQGSSLTQRQVLTDISDYWSEQGPDNAGDRYFMVDEHQVASAGGMARVATLVRLGPTLEEEFHLDGIARYTRFTVSIGALYAQPQAGQSCPGFSTLQDNCPQLFYERPADPGQRFPTLMLWDGTSQVPIGADAGSFQIQTVGNDAYFTLGDQHTLTRLGRPGYALDSLRDNVFSFSVSGDEHYVALTVNDDNKSKTVVRVLETGAEIPTARPNPSGWSGFRGTTFYYFMNAASSSPAELHTLDLLTGEDAFEALPSPLVNVAGVYDRPNSDERLIVDNLGHGVFTSKSDLVALRTLTGPLETPGFTFDGKYLIYVAPAAPTLYDTSVQGPLMFQDADLTTEPAAMVSPPGLLLSTRNGASYFFTEGDDGPILVFWSHLGRASSDLYFADYPGGALPTGLRLVAKSILSVSISAHNLFGILNMSQQDGVGDLVWRNIDTGVDIRYAQAVADVEQCPSKLPCNDLFAYIVRGRADSDRSGLWLDSLAPPVIPDGGSN